MLLYWLESQRLNACRLKFIRKHKSLQCSINEEGQFVQFLFCPKSIFLFHCVIGNVFLVLPIVKKRGAKGDFLSVQRKWQSRAESGEGIAANPKEQQKQLFT